MKNESFLLALFTISTIVGAFLIVYNMSTSDLQVEPQAAELDWIPKGVEPNGDPIGGGGGGPGAKALPSLNLK